ARNIEENFCSLVARLETLGELFYQYGILIYENDSTDKTPSYLTTWSIENPHVKFCSEILNFEMLSDTSQKRLQQMAYARNRLHEMIKRCIPPTYIILVDTDLAGGFSYDGVAHSISYENFDCIGA